MFNPASPTEAWSVSQGRAVRTIKVKWADRIQAARDFLGHAELVEFGGFTYLSRTIPHTYPGTDKLYCTDIPKVEGVGPIGATGSDSTLLAEYQFAILTLVYTTPPYEIYDDNTMLVAGYQDSNGNPSEGAALAAGQPRYVSVAPTPGMRTLVFNRGLVKREDNGAPIPEGIPFPSPHLDFEFTWWHVPQAALPWSVWGKTMGKINDAAFYVSDAQTLLMEAPKVTPITGPFGDRTFNVTFKARYYPQFDFSDPPVAKGWNYILAPTGNGASADLAMVKMVLDGAGGTVTPFRTADFSLCFEPPQ